MKTKQSMNKWLTASTFFAVLFLLSSVFSTFGSQNATRAAQDGKKAIGSCVKDDPQKTFDFAERENGLVFIICDASKKAGLSEEQAKTIQTFASSPARPNVSLNEVGEMIITVPFKTFIENSYKDEEIISGWRGVISALNYVKDNSGTNTFLRYWSLASIDTIETALKGPASIYVTYDKASFGIRGNTTLVVNRDLDSCAALSPDEDPDVSVDTKTNVCIIRASAGPSFFKKPKQGSKATVLLAEALSITQERKLHTYQSLIETMINKYNATATSESANGSLKLTVPDYLVVADYDRIVDGTSIRPGFYGLGIDNNLGIPFAFSPDDSLSKETSGEEISLALFWIGKEENDRLLVDRIPPMRELPATGEFKIDFKKIDPAHLGLGEHGLELAVIGKDGRVLSVLKDSIRIAAPRKTPDAVPVCWTDLMAKNVCAVNYWLPEYFSLDETGDSYWWIIKEGEARRKAEEERKAKETEEEKKAEEEREKSIPVYCRANPAVPDCNDQSSFLLLNLSQIATAENIEKIKQNDLIKPFIMPGDRLRLPASLRPNQIDDMHDTAGQVIEQKAADWETVKLLYLFVANVAENEDKTEDSNLAKHSVLEIDRKIQGDLASFVQTVRNDETIFVIYDYSKLITDADQRNIPTDGYPVIEYNAGADTIGLKTLVDANQVKINRFTKHHWDNLATLYRAIARSAEMLADDPAAKLDLDKAGASLAAIQDKIDKYEASNVYEKVRLDNEDYFWVSDIVSRGMSEDDIERLILAENSVSQDTHDSLAALVKSGVIKLDGRNAFIKSLSPQPEVNTPISAKFWREIKALYEDVLAEANSKKQEQDTASAQKSIETISVPLDAFRTPNGCASNDSQKTFNALEKIDGMLFVVCDAPRKANLSGDEARAISKLGARDGYPYISLNEMGEMDISTPFIEFIEENYKKNDFTLAWQGVVKVLNFIKDNAENNIQYRFWALDSIEKIEAALKGPFLINVSIDRANKITLTAEKDLPVCRELEGVQPADDPDIKVQTEGDKWKCIVVASADPDPYYLKPRQNSVSQRLMENALAAANERGFEDTANLIQVMIEKYKFATPAETATDSLKLFGPQKLVITNFGEAVTDPSIPFTFAGLANGRLPLGYEVNITDSLAKKAFGNPISLELRVENPDGTNQLIEATTPSLNHLQTGQFNLLLTDIGDRYLSFGEHSFTLVVRSNTGEELEKLSHPYTVAATTNPEAIAAAKDCTEDGTCVNRDDPTSGDGGGNSKPSYWDRFWLPTDSNGSSYYNQVLATTLPARIAPAGVDTSTQVYCRSFINSTINCDSDHFLVFNFSSIVPNSQIRQQMKNDAGIKNLAQFFGDSIKVKITVDPATLPDLYKDDGTPDEGKISLWESLKSAYSAVSGNAFVDSDRALAVQAIEEIERRTNQGLASYTRVSNTWKVYDLAKTVKSSGERQSLNQPGDYPVSGATNSVIQVAPTFDYPKYLDLKGLNALNKTDWQNLKAIYESIQASAERRGSAGDTAAATDASQARIAAQEIEKRLSAYNPAGSSYDVVGDDQFFIFDLYSIEGSFTKEDIEQIFRGEPTYPFNEYLKIAGNGAAIPRKITSVNDLSGAQPVVAMYWRKMRKLYEVIYNEATNEAHKNDAKTTIDAISAQLTKFHALGDCGSNEDPYLPKINITPKGDQKIFSICNAVSKLSLSSNQVEAIEEFERTAFEGGNSGYPDIKIGELDNVSRFEITLPFGTFNIQNYKDEKVIAGWQGVISALTYIKDNSTSNADAVMTMNAITTIERGLKGPKLIQTEETASEYILRVHKDIETCSAINGGEDADVVIDNANDVRCTIKMKKDSPTPYIEPIQGSKADNLLQEALGYSDTELTGTIAHRFVSLMAKTYQKSAVGQATNGTLSITAPSSITITNYSEIGGASGGVYSSAPLLDGTYIENNQRIRLFTNYQITDEIRRGSAGKELELALFLQRQDRPELKTEIGKASLEGSAPSGKTNIVGEFRTGNEIGVEPENRLIDIGDRQFQLVLRTADGRVLSSINHDFQFVATGMNDDGVDTTSDNCSDGSLQPMSQDSISTSGDITKIKFTFILPLAPLPNDPNWGYIYRMYVSPNTSESKLIPKELAPDANLGRTPGATVNREFSWDISRTAEGEHLLRIKAFRKDITKLKSPAECAFPVDGAGDFILKVGPPGDNPTLPPQPPTNPPDSPGGKPTIPLDPRHLVGGSGISKLLSTTDFFSNSTLVGRIIKLLLQLISGLAVLGMVIGGIQYITASGDAAKAEKAKKTIIYSTIGIVIAVLSYVIIIAAINTIQAIKF